MTEQGRLAKLAEVIKTIERYATGPQGPGTPNILAALMNYQRQLQRPGVWHWVRHQLRKLTGRGG